MSGFDVGGSHKSQQSGYESFGIQNQAKVVSDGIDHTEGVGGTGFYEDFYANEEVSVGSLGSDVEMNSPGAAVVTTIKSGGNTFKGLEHISYEPGSFVGSNGATSDIAARGYVCPAQRRRRAAVQQPEPVVLGGTRRSRRPDREGQGVVLRRVQPLQDRQAGVRCGAERRHRSRESSTTTPRRGPGKINKNNTLIGYIQAGHKQKPFRNLSTLVPAESILAQDSWSRMYKGEWQSVLSNRAFLTVNVGRFTLDWPMVPAVDPASRVPSIYRSVPGLQTGAGWNAFTSGRSKPQVKAQMTYYLPEKGGSHDFKFGFEDIKDWYRLGINGQSGPYRLSYATPTSADRRPHPLRRHRHARRFRQRLGDVRQRRSALQRVHSGSLGAEQPPDDYGRRALRLPEPDVHGRHPEAADRRLDRRRAGDCLSGVRWSGSRL